MRIAAVNLTGHGMNFDTKIIKAFSSMEVMYKWRNNLDYNIKIVTTAKHVKTGQVIGPREWREDYLPEVLV